MLPLLLALGPNGKKTRTKHKERRPQHLPQTRNTPQSYGAVRVEVDVMVSVDVKQHVKTTTTLHHWGIRRMHSC